MSVNSDPAGIVKSLVESPLPPLSNVADCWKKTVIFSLSVDPLYLKTMTRLWTDIEPLVLSPFYVERSCGTLTRPITYKAKMKEGSHFPDFIIPRYEPNKLTLGFSSEGSQKKGSYVLSITGSIIQLDFSETL
jgi:hypothetical protein